jgi:hypothetical protein
MTLPEINFASRLVKIKGLTPSIDILRLAREYATVDKVNFPVHVDGVCLDLKQRGKQPRILINRNLPKHRLRFTLAHELGHVLIPWHVGSIVDETEESRIDLGLTYWQLEAEANRFASELLMPSEWVEAILERATHPISAAESMSIAAEVSFAAAMIKVQSLLPKGYLFARFVGDELMYSGRTPGTVASMPDAQKAQSRNLFPNAASHWTKSNGSEEYHIWRFHDEMPIEENSTRPWREIFDDISADIAVPPAEASKFKQRVMAVLSFANSSTRTHRSPAAVNSACLQRLYANVGKIPHLEDFVRHPKVNELLAAKISEFFKNSR